MKSINKVSALVRCWIVALILLILVSTVSASEWAITVGIGRDKAYSIQETSDGGYIVAGWTNSFGSGDYDYDAWIIKLNKNGNINGCDNITITTTNTKVTTTSATVIETNAQARSTLAKVIDASAVVTNIDAKVEKICFAQVTTPTSSFSAMDKTTNETSEKRGEIPGFEAVLAIAGLLTVTYLLRKN